MQGKTPDQMQDAANNFSKHLINVVEEYGKSHESAIKNSKKKKISSGLIFAGTATLGIASLAMLVHDLSYALDAADISDARAQRNVSFICITFQHADTQPA